MTRLRRDRVVALRDRERWAEPRNRRTNCGAAAIACRHTSGKRRPTPCSHCDGRRRLGRLTQKFWTAEPRNRSALVGRFYAEIETEDFRAAFATIDALGRKGGRTARPIAAGQARNYADMNAEAWRRLFPISRRAPALAYLRGALGAVAAARGWPRRAARGGGDRRQPCAPGLGGQVALAESALSMRRYAEARRRAAALTDTYGGEAAVQRLADEIHHFDQFELRTEFHSYDEDNSAPDSPVRGSKRQRVSIHALRGPLADFGRIRFGPRPSQLRAGLTDIARAAVWNGGCPH